MVTVHLMQEPRESCAEHHPSTPSPPPLLLHYRSASSLITHLVGVDGHAGGEAHHGDAVEAGGVGDGGGGEVVVGLRRVTHQDGVDLQGHREEVKGEQHDPHFLSV